MEEKKEITENQIVPGIINYASVLRIPVKLNSSNWSSWSLFVHKGLESVGKEDHLSESPPAPSTREWRIDNSGIQMALWNSMEPQILIIAQNFTTVKAMWDHLSSSFSAKESLSHAYSVVQAFSRADQGDSTFTDYFTRFSKLQDELRTLFPPTADLKVQEERNTKMEVMMFIAGISPKYASARPLLLSNSTAIKSVASTYHLLREMYGPDNSSSSTSTDASAMISKSIERSFFKKGTGRGNGEQGSDLICHLCHEPGHAKYNCSNNCHYYKGKGHTKFNCPNRPKGSQPPSHPRARIATSNEPSDQQANDQPIYTLNQEEYDRFQQLISSKIGPQANSAQLGTFPSPDPSWVADSGATHHMTGKKGILSNL